MNNSIQHNIVQRIGEIRGAKDKLEAEENFLWKQFFTIADAIAGEGKPYRYLDKDLMMVMARTVSILESLDEAGLLESPQLSPVARRAITKTVIVIDPVLVEAAITKKKLPIELIWQFTKRKVVLKRIFHPATKEEQKGSV